MFDAKLSTISRDSWSGASISMFMMEHSCWTDVIVRTLEDVVPPPMWLVVSPSSPPPRRVRIMLHCLISDDDNNENDDDNDNAARASLCVVDVGGVWQKEALCGRRG